MSRRADFLGHRAPNRSTTDRALGDLERLVAEHGPVEAVLRWQAQLPLELARGFAGPFGLTVARHYARQLEEARRDDGGDS